MDHSPAKFFFLLMAATAISSSFFLVADARLVHQGRSWRKRSLSHAPAVHAAGGRCIRREKEALLAFKHGINDTTGHVIELVLANGNLVGEISPSLLSLEHLEVFNLGGTSLCGSNGGIPEFLGSLKNLRVLDLSYMVFSGTVPPQLGNLSKLEYLSLPDIYFNGTQMQLKDISWLAGLHVLRYLDMSYMNLSLAVDWAILVSMIPSFEELTLDGCSLSSASRSLPHSNLTYPQYLFLSDNYLDHPIASCWFWNATNIKIHDISDTSLYGPFPNALANMTTLQYLYFDNSIGTGNRATMTVDLKNLCDLEILYLGGSLSSGNITEFLEKLPQCSSNMFAELALNNNHMSGVLPNRLGQLASLDTLGLSNNRITGSIPPGIASCASLHLLYLHNNSLSGNLPSKMNMLGNLNELDISNNNLDGVITKEHLVTLKKLAYLDLSHNSLSGPLPLELGAQIQDLTLSFNYFNGRH